MADENLEAVRRVCTEWERGDWASTADLFDPDLEVRFSSTSFPDGGTYHGGRAVLDAWERWLEVWDEFSMDFEDLIVRGERIVALNRLHGRGRESGASVRRRGRRGVRVRAGRHQAHGLLRPAGGSGGRGMIARYLPPRVQAAPRRTAR